MTRILFIGDIVGELGLAYLEAKLPGIIQEYAVDFVVANAENLDLTAGGCGMTQASLNRLFAVGVELVTGGNHSWDAPDQRVHEDLRVLRPLNYLPDAPGRGVGVLEKHGTRLHVVNLASATAMPGVSDPLATLETQLAAWGDVDQPVLVDFHGESVMEKMTLAFAVAGRVTAVVGTHTHVPTLDTRLLPGGTAYVTDVGMTGAGDGLQGYAPSQFVEAMYAELPPGKPLQFAAGAVELGAVLIVAEGRVAAAVARCSNTG